MCALLRAMRLPRPRTAAVAGGAARPRNPTGPILTSGSDRRRPSLLYCNPSCDSVAGRRHCRYIGIPTLIVLPAGDTAKYTVTSTLMESPAGQGRSGRLCGEVGATYLAPPTPTWLIS
jgi:hypothetical protein